MIVQTALAVVCVLGLLVAEAEPAGKAYTIGILTGDSPFHRAFVGTFKQTLFDLGYDEKQIHFKERFAESANVLARDASELIRARVDVLAAFTTQPAVAAKAATRSTPIVFAMVTDPIASGLVATLAKPGGNVTGITDIQAEISAKRVQLLKELLPRLSRVAVLWNAGHPGKRLEFNEIASGARVVGVGLVSVEVRTANDFDAAFRRLTQTQVDALIVLAEPLVLSRIADILQLTAQRRLSDMYESRTAVEGGGLLSYGSATADQARRAAGYVDRILKGARPADLPVERPTKFELVINLKTAKTLGLTIPPSLLLRADHTIE